MSLTNVFIRLLTKSILKLQIKKNIGLVNLSIFYTWKNIKSAYNNNKFKMSAPTWMMNLICLMVLIQSLTFNICLHLSSKSTKL